MCFTHWVEASGNLEHSAYNVIVTNLETPSRAVVRFYNKRGTAEQWITEGKQVKMTRLSLSSFSLKPGAAGAEPADLQSGATCGGGWHCPDESRTGRRRVCSNVW